MPSFILLRPPTAELRSPAATATLPDPCSFDPRQLDIDLTQHAVERFRERVRPGLDEQRARQELARLVDLGEVSSVAPLWLAHSSRQRAAFYLIIGDLVLPLEPSRGDQSRLQALTCIVAGGISAGARERRNTRRAANRRRHRGSTRIA